MQNMNTCSQLSIFSKPTVSRTKLIVAQTNQTTNNNLQSDFDKLGYLSKQLVYFKNSVYKYIITEGSNSK